MQQYPEHIFRAYGNNRNLCLLWSWTLVKKGCVFQSEVQSGFFDRNQVSWSWTLVKKGCVFQSEVQSGFFDRNQVTIHPVICYLRKKQEDKEFKVKHAIISILSEDTNNDADLAITFENKAMEVLENKCVKIDEVYEWTDGCAAHYKRRNAFADISLRKKLTVIRIYFETSHGKNVHDGLGARVINAFCS